MYSQGARQWAAALSLVAGATLLLRIILKFDETGSVPEAVSYLTNFFTILTNALVFGIALVVACGGRVVPRVLQAVTIAIVGVGLVYHVALAHLLDLAGLALLADHGVHTVVPAMTLFWWLFLLPKQPFRWSDMGVWTVWPLIYCGYILIRASSSGFYPYPFLNLPELGVAGLVQSILFLCLAFVAIGLVMTGVARIIGSLQWGPDKA
jgi:hypothetical protein